METVLALGLCASGASTYIGAAGWETNSTSKFTKTKSQEKVKHNQKVKNVRVLSV
jgi:hypothetical protein